MQPGGMWHTLPYSSIMLVTHKKNQPKFPGGVIAQSQRQGFQDNNPGSTYYLHKLIKQNKTKANNPKTCNQSAE